MGGSSIRSSAKSKKTKKERAKKRTESPHAPAVQSPDGEFDVPVAPSKRSSQVGISGGQREKKGQCTFLGVVTDADAEKALENAQSVLYYRYEGARIPIDLPLAIAFRINNTNIINNVRRVETRENRVMWRMDYESSNTPYFTSLTGLARFYLAHPSVLNVF